MRLRNLNVERQKVIPVVYKNLRLNTGLRLDFLVEEKVIVELKAVEQVLPIHRAQVKTYLSVTGCKLGLVINFNVLQLIKGVHRVILGDLLELENMD
jgi:GxxExxY protein